MMGRMAADRERQAVTVHNGHDFHAFATLCFADAVPAALGGGEGRVDETLQFIDLALAAPRVGDIGQRRARDVAAAPLLKSPLHGFVVGIALRQQCAIARRC